MIAPVSNHTLPPIPLSVLIADDDATTRALFSAFVRGMGYRVTAVGDGDAAWAAFEAHEPQLLIIDCVMPGLDGLELCRRVRERAGDRCLVMVITAREAAENLDQALAAGADDYLTKPVSREQFHARVVIAERRLAAAHARRAAIEEAARMRWLAGIGHTVLTLQHEVNNPLTALYGSLESLACSENLLPSDRRNANIALEQAERIADVVRRLSRTDRHSTIEAIPGVTMLSLAPAPVLEEEYQ
jgi:DNA-binding response OmpR family regulator